MGIQTFYNNHVKIKELEGTTSDMLSIVKDITKSDEGSGSSYCQKLLNNDQTKALVGPATVFVSHAWKYNFAEFQSALLARFSKEPEAFLWIDIFSHNQHNELSSDEWITNFEEHIKRINRTVMIAIPWKNPIPFTRYFNLFFQIVISSLPTLIFLMSGRGVCWKCSTIRRIKCPSRST